jgi:hypothetical protein
VATKGPTHRANFDERSYWYYTLLDTILPARLHGYALSKAVLGTMTLP